MKESIRTGNLWRQILLFALPIAATSMLEQLFNSADIAVVGRFGGSNALAAVGSTSSIINLYITIFTGLSIGANVMVAQMIGAGNRDGIKKTIHTSLILALISGFIMMIIGFFLAGPLLEAMGTPEEIMGLAKKYLQIYMLGAVFLMVYNFEAAIMRANGDTRRPLYCLLFSGVLNVILNLFFVIVFHMNIEGVAIATVISNATGAFLLFQSLTKAQSVIHVELSELRIDKGRMLAILKIGVPAAIQGMMFNIANVLIQTGFNQLGADVIAASTIGLNAEIFVYYLMNSFGQTCVTFNGQNYGAGDYKRCKDATRVCLVLGEFITMSLALLFLTFRIPFSRIYSTDTGIIALAQIRLVSVLSFEMFNVIIEVLSGALRGLGYSFIPAALSAFFVCGVRVVWIFAVFPIAHSFKQLLIVYPVSWIAASVVITIAYFLVRKRVLHPTL